MAIERKYERDIDLLLAEEFKVSPRFAVWFLKQTTKFADADANVLDVYVSRSDSTGESDLVVVFDKRVGDSRFALLIEDKIDAPLQPEQEARYRLRAAAEVLRGVYSDYEVILCSPEAYPATHPEASAFDSAVPYEAIEKFLRTCEPEDPRTIYRANFLATAAKRSANSWTPVDDPSTNAFWERAYDIAIKEFSDLEMQPLELTKDSTWINFRPKDMPTRPRRIYISFKGDRGFMDLTFTGSAAHLFAPLVRPILEDGMTVHQTGKSAAIRIRVEGFKISEPTNAVLEKVRKAFSASTRLIRFYRQHREALDRAASESVPPLLGARVSVQL
jgi:hypothetical protein